MPLREGVGVVLHRMLLFTVYSAASGRGRNWCIERREN